VKQSLHFKEYIQLVERNHLSLQRTFFLFTLLFFVVNYFSHGFIHQIGNNPLVYQEIDPTYWAFMILKVHNLAKGAGAIILDSVLIISALASFLFPKQALACLVFFISYFIYFVLYNLLSGHHYIHIGILFLSFPFVFSSKQKFSAAFTFCRFLFCQALLFAAFWKIMRGNLWHTDQVPALLIDQFKSSAFTNQSFRFQIIRYCIQHPYVGHLLWIGVILLESVFLIGFFTWKKDNWLLISYLLFVIGGWFFFGVYILENLILLLTLGPVLKFIDIRFRKVLREKQHPTTLSNLATGVPLPDERSSSRH
jgi:hypothetical protein